MATHARLLGTAIAASLLGSPAFSDTPKTWKGAWKFEIDRSERPWLGYYDTAGKVVFRFGCGTHVELDAVYPGDAPKQDHAEASIRIASGRKQMDFAGFTYAAPDSFPPDTAMFNQPDLGQPGLEEKQWRALENRFLDILDSGQPLTISAGDKSYVLPPVKAPRWRARFQKIC